MQADVGRPHRAIIAAAARAAKGQLPAASRDSRGNLVAVRWSAICCAALGFGASSVARAETADELQARGEALAKAGQYTAAIDVFKAADRVEVRASHACLIALAYTRRELWPQAEIFLSRCQELATAADPLPVWFPEAKAQLEQRLAIAKVAPVTIQVRPTPPGTKLSVSSFAPDEKFAPRTIHLPPGHHVVLAEADGVWGEQQLDITDTAPRALVIELHPRGWRPNAPPTVDRGRAWIVAGGVALGAGLITYGAMGVSYRKLADHNAADYDRYSTLYDVTRASTIVLWAAGAGSLVTGYILHRRSAEAPSVSALPLPGGAMVSLGWSR
jgi:hypothetical protein